MDIPDPADARDLARVLQCAADDVRFVVTALSDIGARAHAHWNGDSAQTAGEVVAYLVAEANSVSGSFENLSRAWYDVADQLDNARRKMSTIHKAEWISGVLTVGSIVQLGLDPATDLAAGATAGGAAGIAFAARKIVEDAFASFTARFLLERGALIAIRSFATWAAPRIAIGFAGNLALQELTAGRADPRSAANLGLAGVLIPGGKLHEIGPVVDPVVEVPVIEVPVVEVPDLSWMKTWGKAWKLPQHFSDHGADFGATSPQEYVEQAAKFLQRSKIERLPIKFDSENATIRTYDRKTNEFGAYNIDKTTKTYYAPDRKEEYWDEQPGKIVVDLKLFWKALEDGRIK